MFPRLLAERHGERPLSCHPVLLSPCRSAEASIRARRATFVMPDNYFARYLPLLIHLIVALFIATMIVLLSGWLGKHRPTRVKLQPYECGITPTGDARQRFSVKFYLVAMLFILFDVEAVFMYPWAVVYRELKMFGFWEMLIYIAILLVGFW